MGVKFDTTARRAIDLAMVDVEARGHATLDSLHLLIGLLDPRSGVAALIKRMGVDPATAHARVGDALGTNESAEPDAPVEVAGVTEEILQRSSNLSRERGASSVSDVDILRALVERTDTAAARVLTSLGITTERLQSELGDAASARKTGNTPAEGSAAMGAPALTSRVGIGYDSHRFADGGPLRLGGVDIPSRRKLAGHSDGDAIAHALTDAILGAASLGDIGAMYPDSDPANRGRDSAEMLAAAVAAVRETGWVVAQADVTVIAEEPRLGPHRDAMRAAMAKAMRMPPDRLGIKGKTNEGMGWIGRGEGIACIAVATLVPAAPR